MEHKKEFASLEEAFGALSQQAQEHSLRVEKYTDLIFMELCAAEEYTGNIRSRVRLKPENRAVAAQAGRYHDLGKVLVPEFYQWNSEDYSPEEMALYRRHCVAGEEMAYHILQQTKGYTPAMIETVCEGMRCHHEWWDGKGYPKGTEQEITPVMGRIVAVANRLDHLLMETYTENPVTVVVNQMMEESGTRYDPVIMGLLYDCKHKLEKIFTLYQAESKAIPKTLRVLRRKAKRPMWLRYRPIVDMKEHTIAALEADMQFRLGKEDVGFAQVEQLIQQSKNMQELGMAFLLEASDMARRMRTCQVGGEFVALNCVPGFLRKRGAATAILKLLADTDSDPKTLGLILRPEDAADPTVTVKENCNKLRGAGCRLMLSDMPLEQLELAWVQELRLTHLRLSAQDVEQLGQHKALLQVIARRDVTVIGDGIEKYRFSDALLDRHICLGTGDLLGEYTSEEQFIANELALRKD